MARSKSKNVGVIGLGIIGSRIAGVLRKRGFQVYVWNRTPRLEQNFVGSPAEVAELCNFVQIFVSDDAALLETVSQIVPALTAHHVTLAHCTIGPDTMRTASQMVERRGARFLEAPFTGSKMAAESGQLVYYIGGDELALKQARPVLEASSKEIIPIGEIGSASIIKVATNIVTAATAQIGAEALAIVRQAGISGETFSRAMKANASNSATLEMKVPMILKGDFEPHFSVKHMLKDVRIAARLAREFGIEVPMAEIATDMLLAEMKHGRGDADYSSVAQRYFPVSGKLPEPGIDKFQWEERTKRRTQREAALQAPPEPEPQPAEVTHETPKLEPTEAHEPPLEEPGPFAIATEQKPEEPSAEGHELTPRSPPETEQSVELRSGETPVEEFNPLEVRAEQPRPAPTMAEESQPAEAELETKPAELKIEAPKADEVAALEPRLERPTEDQKSDEPLAAETKPEEPMLQGPPVEARNRAEGMLVELKPPPEPSAEVPSEPKPDELPPIRLKISAPQQREPEATPAGAEQPGERTTPETTRSEVQANGTQSEEEEQPPEGINLSGGFRGWFSRMLSGRRKGKP